MSRSKGRYEDNWIAYLDTLLQYHLKINPAVLSDEQWAEKVSQLQDILSNHKKNGF